MSDAIEVKQTRLSKELWRHVEDWALGRSNKRIFVNQGGTYSGKTVAVIQNIVVLSAKFNNSPLPTTVVAQDYPSLRLGALNDWDIHVRDSDLGVLIEDYKKGPREARLVNGSRIQFKQYQDGQTAKGGKRWGLFINEADGVKWEIADELIRRTSGPIFIDYNPTGEFWVQDEVLNREDCVFIKSDYTWNEYCPDNTVAEILSYKTKGFKVPDLEEYDFPGNVKNVFWANKWRVYGRGDLGVAYDLVFPNSERYYHEFPQEARKVGYTMDLGFSNDPTTLIKTGIVGDRVYTEELLYRPGMTTPEIKRFLEDIGVTSGIKIDGASGGDRVAEELSRAGIGIRTVKKEHIKVGIEKLNRYKLYIKGENFWKERKSYKYNKNRSGDLDKEPIDDWNHCFDPLRYWAVDNIRLPNVRKKYKVYI